MGPALDIRARLNPNWPHLVERSQPEAEDKSTKVEVAAATAESIAEGLDSASLPEEHSQVAERTWGLAASPVATVYHCQGIIVGSGLEKAPIGKGRRSSSAATHERDPF